MKVTVTDIKYCQLNIDKIDKITPHFKIHHNINNLKISDT